MPAPASLPVMPARHTLTDSVVNEMLHPVDLNVPTACNCFVFPGNPTFWLIRLLTVSDEDGNATESDEAEKVDELDLFSDEVNGEEEEVTKKVEGTVVKKVKN